MSWLSKRARPAADGTTAGSRAAAVAAFAEIAPASGRDAIVSALAQAIEAAQRARLAGEPAAALILAAAHLAAAAAGHTESIPAEMEIRSIGHAAAALAGASSSAGEPGAIEEIVRARFAIARGRVRGSIYVPRDVEYAFSGDVRALEPMALDPARAPQLRKLLAAGVEAALAKRPGGWTDADREFFGRFEAAARLP